MYELFEGLMDPGDPVSWAHRAAGRTLVLNLEPYTLNPNPKTPNPKPQTLSSKL
jgi:hypothetical protein